jgi:hypothetical protein
MRGKISSCAGTAAFAALPPALHSRNVAARRPEVTATLPEACAAVLCAGRLMLMTDIELLRSGPEICDNTGWTTSLRLL